MFTNKNVTKKEKYTTPNTKHKKTKTAPKQNYLTNPSSIEDPLDQGNGAMDPRQKYTVNHLEVAGSDGSLQHRPQLGLQVDGRHLFATDLHLR